MRVIKRYANRRLYDPETSKTVTLEHIAELIRKQEEFKVVDNPTSEDITNKILAQTFLKVNLQGVDETLNQYLLSTLIRESSDNMQQFAQKMVLSGIGMANQTKEYIEHVVELVIKDLPFQALNGSKESGDKNPLQNISDYVLQQADSLTHQVHSGIQAIPLPWNNQNEEWEQRCKELEQQVEALQKKVADKEEEIMQIKQSRGSDRGSSIS